ncbi:hypothetical protein RCS94_10805 [Orbaceae bacterium ac157xtp]
MIQLRMDLINPTGDKGICLLYKDIKSLPYANEDRRYYPMTRAQKNGLVNEILSHSLYNDKYSVNYNYQLTELGKSYFTTWPDVNHIGFCYGKLVVESIYNVNNLTVTYQFRIEQSPEWAYDLVQPYFKKPLNEPQTEVAKFGYNEQGELISLTSNYNYYLK